MKKICFVILHYKDLAVTDLCVSSILAMDHQDEIEIVVVDNDIQKMEAERQEIADKYAPVPNIHVIPVMENGGFSYANNAGYRYARKQLGASYIVVCNNDIVFPQKDFPQLLWEIQDREPCHLLGPDVIREGTGEHQNPLDENIRSLKQAEYTIRMNHYALKLFPLAYPALYLMTERANKQNTRNRTTNEEYYRQEHRNVVLFGACLIYMPAFVEKESRAFAPETSFYYEEYILGLRCKVKGYETLYIPKLRALHEGGAVTRSTMKTQKNRLRFIIEKTQDSARIYRNCLKQHMECNPGSSSDQSEHN